MQTSIGNVIQKDGKIKRIHETRKQNDSKAISTIHSKSNVNKSSAIYVMNAPVDKFLGVALIDEYLIYERFDLR